MTNALAWRVFGWLGSEVVMAVPFQAKNINEKLGLFLSKIRLTLNTLSHSKKNILFCPTVKKNTQESPPVKSHSFENVPPMKSMAISLKLHPP